MSGTAEDPKRQMAKGRTWMEYFWRQGSDPEAITGCYVFTGEPENPVPPEQRDDSVGSESE